MDQETTFDDVETTYTVVSVNGERKKYVLGKPETAPVADAVRDVLVNAPAAQTPSA